MVVVKGGKAQIPGLLAQRCRKLPAERNVADIAHARLLLVFAEASKNVYDAAARATALVEGPAAAPTPARP